MTYAALLAKIRQEGDEVEIDPFEASRIIEQLSQADVDDVVPVGGSFRVVTRRLKGIGTSAGAERGSAPRHTFADMLRTGQDASLQSSIVRRDRCAFGTQ